MQKDKVNAAVIAAKEFIRRAGEYKDETGKTYTAGEHTFHCDAPKQSGALRRQSMELTRSLAEMRKP